MPWYSQAYDNMEVMGLTVRDVVALKAMLRSPFHQKQLGFDGSWSSLPNVFTPFYYKVLLRQTFTFDGKQVSVIPPFIEFISLLFILIIHSAIVF